MKKISILLVCVLLLTAVGCGSQKGSEKENAAESSSVNKGYYTLNVKINPDVSFLVDGKQVVGVVTNNDDARDVYNNIDFSSYDVDVVVNEWAAQCEKMGFNTHKMEVGICGSEEDIISFSDTWDQLKEDYQVSDAGDIQSIEEQAEMPVCEFCRKQLFDVYDLCPDCGHEVGYEVIECFCGAKMATDSKPCPVCHLNNLSGEYEEGWGPEGKNYLYCFCGNKCDSESGICGVCHLNNYTGTYEDGYGDSDSEAGRCFCGEGNIDPVTGVCPVCHLNNFTGAYEAGYGHQEANDEPQEEIIALQEEIIAPQEEVLRCFCGSTDVDWVTGLCRSCHLYNYTGKYEPDPNCTYCHGTGYYDWVCDVCNGDGLRRPDVCFQCFGEGTCFVTPGSGDGPGWWETCSICHGTGINADTLTGPCRACEGVGVRKNAVRCEHCWE